MTDRDTGPSPWRWLVLYDGECGLCDRSVQLILRHDKKRVLQFAPLQGVTAAPLVGSAAAFDTMVYVERAADGTVRRYERSRAVFRILSKMGGFWKALSILRILPTALMDVFYNIVAKNRIRWWGRVDACRLPDPQTAARFLP